MHQPETAPAQPDEPTLATLWERYLSIARDDGLTDVQRTARFVAGLRAFDERLSERPLVVDPLAALLAGPEIMSVIGELLQQAMPVHEKDDFNHNPFVTRGFIIDNMVVREIKTLRAANAQGNTRFQVVNIGAGMDTRPWRLSDLGQDVSWFEVDMHEMVTLKRQLLAKAGAQLPEQPSGKPSAPATAVEMQDTTAPKDNTLGAGLELMGSPFPITCGRLVAIPCKLEGSENGAGLIPALMNAGYDKTCPTVWIAEGLVMYLEPSTLEGLLVDMENLSTPGSKAIISVVTQEMLQEMRTIMQASTGRPDIMIYTSGAELTGEGGSSQGLLQFHGWSLVYNLNDLRDLLPDLAPGHHSRNFAFLSMKSVVEGLVVAERKEGIRL